MANPGGAVGGSWAGGLGEGGVCGEAVATNQVYPVILMVHQYHFRT
jgi:hypothetical protein